jgi:hypothetical protein
MIAVTIPYLPIDNRWFNSVQKHILASQVSDRIEFENSSVSPSRPPIKRSESPYSSIECKPIALGSFGPEREE